MTIAYHICFAKSTKFKICEIGYHRVSEALIVNDIKNYGRRLNDKIGQKHSRGACLQRNAPLLVFSWPRTSFIRHRRRRYAAQLTAARLSTSYERRSNFKKAPKKSTLLGAFLLYLGSVYTPKKCPKKALLLKSHRVLQIYLQCLPSGFSFRNYRQSNF